MAKNNGKSAEEAFEVYWARIGHVERMPDMRDLVGLNGGRKLKDFPKPCDFLVSAPGVPLHMAEVKSTNHTSRFPFADIRPKQSSTALLSAKRGDKGYKFYIFSFYLSQWFVMTAVDYAECVSLGARSISFSDLTPWSVT